MKAVSLDLRERVSEALESDASSLRVAARFRVSSSFVRKLRLRKIRTGTIEALPLPGRERLVQGDAQDKLRALVAQHPDATLNVLRELLAEETGIAVSETTMWRQLRRMDITLKKKVLHASEQQRPDVIVKRARFRRRMRLWRVPRLVFIDESGVNLSLTRAEGRAPRGERLVDHVPGGRWENYSVIAALRSDGIVAPMVLPGAMNSDALRTWVVECLSPVLRPGDIVVWDNLGIHGDPMVASAIRRRGARLTFLPPYSPDLNPIEKAWSKMKSILRLIGARAKDALMQGIGEALRAITPRDCAGWFRHAGYTRNDAHIARHSDLSQ